MKIKIVAKKEGKEKASTIRIPLPLWLINTPLSRRLILKGISSEGKDNKKIEKRDFVSHSNVVCDTDEAQTDVDQLDNVVCDTDGNTDGDTDNQADQNNADVETDNQADQNNADGNTDGETDTQTDQNNADVETDTQADQNNADGDTDGNTDGDTEGKTKGNKKDFFSDLIKKLFSDINNKDLKKFLRPCLMEMRKYRGLVIVNVVSKDTEITIKL